MEKKQMIKETLIEKLSREARDEVNKELMETARQEIKEKLYQLNNAKKLVANIEREIEDLEIKLEQELS